MVLFAPEEALSAYRQRRLQVVGTAELQLMPLLLHYFVGLEGVCNKDSSPSAVCWLQDNAGLIQTHVAQVVGVVC